MEGVPDHLSEKDAASYYEALGRFITAFANIELFLYMAIGSIAGMPSRVAGALVSGAKAETAISFLRRLALAKDRVLTPRFEHVLSHINAINTMRNFLVHWETFADEQGIQVTNIVKTYKMYGYERRAVSVEMLQDMLADLDTIADALDYQAIYLAPEGPPPAPEPPPKWRYKPQPPIPPRRDYQDHRE